MFKTKITGRAALTRRLREVAPNAEKYAADAKYDVAQEAAELIENAAPLGDTGDYRASIQGDWQRNRPNAPTIGGERSKDPDATGIYANYIWRFLEFGTAPHNTAKGGGNALGRATFTVGGGNRHPGTRAQPHLFSTWRAFRPKAMRRVRDAINRAVREAQNGR